MSNDDAIGPLNPSLGEKGAEVGSGVGASGDAADGDLVELEHAIEEGSEGDGAALDEVLVGEDEGGVLRRMRRWGEKEERTLRLW